MIIIGKCSLCPISPNLTSTPLQNSVHLTPTPINPSSYINASHIKMEHQNRKEIYIACQGPLEETTEDFWAMIWQQKVQMIVMVTGFIEDGIVKCFEYFPLSLNQTLTFGDFQVNFKTFIHYYALFISNKLNIYRKNSSKSKQIHNIFGERSSWDIGQNIDISFISSIQTG